MSKISVVLPIYLSKPHLKEMTEECIRQAKRNPGVDIEWVIVETESTYFINEADVYIYEKYKTTPNHSINNAFKLCSGDYVVFLGNDVFVEDLWCKYLLDCFDQKKDCGLATLGNNEHNDEISNDIVEQIYFSICMFRKEDAFFDTNYDDLFDDTDMIMRVYARGEKCYKNKRGFVKHLNHQTYGLQDLSLDKNRRQREYFIKKWEKYSYLPIFNVLK